MNEANSAFWSALDGSGLGCNGLRRTNGLRSNGLGSGFPSLTRDKA